MESIEMNHETTDEAQSDDSGGGESAQSEAVNYRLRLREVEADTAKLRQEVMENHEIVLSIAARQPVKGKVLADYTDLFDVGGVDRVSLFGADDHLDEAKLSEALAVLYEQRPGLFVADKSNQFEPCNAWKPPINPLLRDGDVTPPPRNATMSDLLRRAR